MSEIHDSMKKNKFFFSFHYVGQGNFIWISSIMKKFFSAYHFAWIGLRGAISSHRTTVISPVPLCPRNRVTVTPHSVTFSGAACGVCSAGCHKPVPVTALVVAACTGGHTVVPNPVIAICTLETPPLAVTQMTVGHTGSIAATGRNHTRSCKSGK